MRRSLISVFNASPKKAGAVSNVVATLAGNGDANITWTNPPAASYDYVFIEQSINGGGFVLTWQAAKGDTAFYATQGYSVDAAWRLYTTKAGWSNSNTVTSGTIRSLPAPPSLQSFIRRSLPPRLELSWNSPGHGNITGYDAALSATDGASWNTTRDASTNLFYYFEAPPEASISPGPAYRGRARTRDGFGQVSAWVVWPNAL